jgi:hypothetical protein
VTHGRRVVGSIWQAADRLGPSVPGSPLASVRDPLRGERAYASLNGWSIGTGRT